MIDNFALTTDLSRGRNLFNFIIITIHFLDLSNTLHSIKISFDRFIGQQTAVRLEAYIRRQLEMYKIPVDKVSTITTDNGSDIKSAASRIATRLSCICHNLNLIVKNGLKLYSK